MPEKIQSLPVVCEGGLNATENHLDLSARVPGSATRLINHEPANTGGYRRITGYDLLDAQYPEVGAGVCEGPVLGIEIFKAAVLGSPVIIASRKDIGADTYSIWRYVPLGGWVKYDHPARSFSVGGRTVTRVRATQFDFGGGDQICFVDGVNSALVFNGTEWSEITPGAENMDQALARPSLVGVFRNHLFVAGDLTYPSVVAHSAPNNALDWSAAAGGGQVLPSFKVVQFKPFRNELFVFGESKISKVRASNEGFTVEPVTTNVGCVAPDSVQEVGGNLIFLAPDGIRPVAGTARIGDVELDTISRDFNSRIEVNIFGTDLDHLVGVSIRSKAQFRLFVGGNDSDRSTAYGILGGLVNRQGQPSWEFSELMGFRASCACAEYIGHKEWVLSGDWDGRVYRQEMGTSFAGDPITAIYSTPYLDNGEPSVRSTLRRLNMFIRPEGPAELSLSVSFDWGDGNVETPAPYDMVSGGVTPTYGTSLIRYGDGSVYGSSTRPVLVSDIQGSGFSSRLTFVSHGDFASYTIQGFILEFSTDGRN